MPGIRTAAEAKAWLDEQGKSVQEFARENSVDAATTYQVLSGRKKGRRGESHRVAVLLGMKAGVEQTQMRQSSSGLSMAE
ncbi:MAG: DNA-binding protein [Pseudomonas sp.]|nr:DNA-binding protein [Pseudomonas sp.]